MTVHKSMSLAGCALASHTLLRWQQGGSLTGGENCRPSVSSAN